MDQHVIETTRDAGPVDYATRKRADMPLNLEEDQAAYIRRRIAKLNLELGLEKVGRYSLPVIAAAGIGMLLLKRYKAASAIAAVLLLRQGLKLWRPETRLIPTRNRNDIELDVYAMKLERGDYGKLEVIPFR